MVCSMENIEIWREIPGFEGFYEASSLGRIRSVARVVPATRNGIAATRLSPSKVLKPHLNTARGGYYSVKTCVEGRALTKAVHSMVCAAFHGPRPEGMTAAHNNGDSTDNRPENLRWDTLKANHADKISHGTLLRGSANPEAKLTDDDVRLIKNSPESASAIARKLGVSFSLVCRIRRGERWSHIE